MLQRIYGTAFSNKKDLKAHLKLLEELKKRDHRRLGPQLDIYNVFPEGGAGLIYYLPKGSVLRDVICDFERKEHLKLKECL